MSVEAERMRTALDLHDLGVKLYRQRMRRQFAEASERQIDALVRDWLIEPPRTGGKQAPRGEMANGHRG